MISGTEALTTLRVPGALGTPPMLFVPPPGDLAPASNHVLWICDLWPRERVRSDRATAVLDASGRVYRIIGVAKEVTERHKAEDAALAVAATLREERDRLSLIAATSPAAICSFQRPPGGVMRCTFGSERLAVLFGVPAEQLASGALQIIDGIVPEDRQAANDAARRALNEDGPFRHEFRYQHPVQGEIWIEGNFMPAREADGSAVWHGSMTDITVRKRGEEEIRRYPARRRRSPRSRDDAARQEQGPHSPPHPRGLS